MRRSFVQHLPVEQWQQVLANVSHGDLCSVMLTSRHMNSVANWPELWAGMEVNMEKVRQEGLVQLYSINRFNKVKQMSFEGMNLTNVEVERLLADIPGSPLENINFASNELSRYTPDQAELLANAVKNLNTVKLSCTSLTTIQCIKVLEAILSSRTLVDLNLGFIDLHGVPPDLLASAVKCLIISNLSDTGLATDQCIKVLEASLSSTTLVDLDLSRVDLSGVPPTLLASAVKRLKTIKLLGTVLTTDQCIKVLDTSLFSTTLVDLDLGFIDLHGVPPNLLASAIKRLNTANLPYTHMTTEQCVKVLETSLSSTTLVDLDLSKVDLSGVPPNLLASAVKRLKRIKLLNCYLTTDQCIKVLEASLSSTTLVDLDLTKIDLSGVPPNLLASAVKRLKTIRLLGTDLTTDQCIKILESSLFSTTLFDLDIGFVNLSGVPPNLLASAVKRLKTIKLWKTRLTVEQCVAVLNCIPTSTTLRLVDLRFNITRENLPVHLQYLLISSPAYVIYEKGIIH